MNYLIEDQSQLNELQYKLGLLSEQSGVIAVDTEFIREKTYKARLCLVQLGIGENQYCIDVLAIEDLSLLADLFSDPNITKLFHAARQDLEVIYQTLEVMPKPIFDTQLAAAFCGSDMQIGYAALVMDKLAVELAKTQSRTDWSRRPLSAEQIKYAGDDVAYLEALYNDAVQTLDVQGKRDWFGEEIENYYDVGLYTFDPAMAYTRLSGGGLTVEQQYTLQALAEWREAGAQKRNIPRGWLMSDDCLFELSVKRPTTVQQIIDMGVFGKKSVKYLAPKAVDLIASVTVGDELIWNKVEPLQKHEKRLCNTMMSELKGYAKQHSVAQTLLGTRRDIESLYRHNSSKKLLTGWREELVGQPLLAFLQDQTA